MEELPEITPEELKNLPPKNQNRILDECLEFLDHFDTYKDNLRRCGNGYSESRSEAYGDCRDDLDKMRSGIDSICQILDGADLENVDDVPKSYTYR